VPAYLTTAQFIDRTVAPPAYIAAVEARSPGWTQQQLAQESARIDARLRKRYAAPFVAGDGSPNAPELVNVWLTRVVTRSVYLRRGVDPTDELWSEIREDARLAETELKEAADGATGLWDLPLRDAPGTTSGISQGGPRSYSEASPYVYTDVQRAIATGEDQSGRET